MQLALESSNLTPKSIDYINAHATSTPAGDLAELNAIKALFRNANEKRSSDEKVYVSSYKGSLGHLLGAAGAVETALTVLACKTLIIPSSINIKKLDPAFKLEETPFIEIVKNEKLTLNKSRENFFALKNSFGFGGTNVCLAISRYIK
jgi:3-oxoacyl-[acyl-carrier-protein] synthase II